MSEGSKAIIKIGVIREGKTPPDTRVPFSPKQCRDLLDQHDNLEIYIQPSLNRSYTDKEYAALNIPLKEDLSDCDILMGVKEVPKNNLIENKKYLFFSHTIKKQPYNKKLLQTILAKNIQLIDYECLRQNDGQRIIGFGRHAGIVGAHNGMLVYGKKMELFDLKAAHKAKDFNELKNIYKTLIIPPIKILVTGGGRVAQGSKETLEAMQIREVSVADYLTKTYDEAVFTMADSCDLYQRKSDNAFEKKEFYTVPQNYKCDFKAFTKVTDLMINGIYWHPEAPVFFTKNDMKQADFAIKVIADVTCDIEGSIPATTRATVIGDPTLGYDPQTEKEVTPYQAHTIDIMSIDNLPNELPRDASQAFGETLSTDIIPELLNPNSTIIDNASITKNGKLNGKYIYLSDYVSG